MEYRTIGTSDLKVPVICLGTMNWGQQNTEKEAHEQLSYAIDERGLTFIDTAEMYPVPPEAEKQGRTETYIGNWLAKRGKRDDLIIATKVTPSPLIRTRNIGDKSRLDRASIRDAIEGSLSRLQTDYVDLYQVHFPERRTNFFGVRGYVHDPSDESTPIEETLEALGELVKEGKVRYIGVSNETPWGVSEYLRISREKSLPRIVSIQNQYSLTNRTFEIGLAEIAIREKVGLLAYSTLGMGVLTGKYLGGSKPAGARFTLFERNSERYNSPIAQDAIKKYVKIARDHNIDPAQLAIAFAKDRQFLSSVIIGTTTLDQLKVDIDSADLHLSEDVLQAIDAVYKQFPDVTA